MVHAGQGFGDRDFFYGYDTGEAEQCHDVPGWMQTDCCST